MFNSNVQVTKPTRKDPFVRVRHAAERHRGRFIARLARKEDIPFIRSLYEVNSFALDSIPSDKALLNRMENFGPGEIVVIRTDTGAVVCYSSNLPVSKELSDQRQLTSNQLKDMSASDGETTLLRRIFLTHPLVNDEQPSLLIDRASKRLATRMGIRSVMVASRVPGYLDVCNAIEFEDYVQRLRQDRIANRNVALWKAAGYEILRGLPDFRKADTESAGCAVLMEWRSLWSRLPERLGLRAEPKMLPYGRRHSKLPPGPGRIWNVIYPFFGGK